MKKLFFLFISFALYNLPYSFSQKYELPIDGSHSVVSFSVGFAGGISSIDGRFNDFEGVIGYADRSDLSSLFCNVNIDVNSLNTGNTNRDKDLNGAGWFNSEEFPEIIFESTRTIATDDGYNIIGNFTMMGITEEINIPFKYTHDQDVVFVFGEPRVAALGSFQLDRTKYGIPKRGFGNIIPSLGTMALLKEVDVKLMIMGRGPSMAGLVSKKIESENSEAGIILYEEMEKKHAGKDTYGFGERTIGSIANSLVRNEKLQEAVEVAEYGVKRYPESSTSHYVLAAAYEKTGNTQKAIMSYKKSLDINPEFKRAQGALEKLEEK
ncbi:MAG: YceI family protein [Saprospiraceae bacterium]|nr:YceI family protein [Saprospiraceae bacterium]|tara:strand:- start:333 stop:1301 length:969 start_codon:yes stop_codon:yes gene_type:complete